MWRANFGRVDFEGKTLEGFRAISGLHRGYGKLQLVPHDVAGWVLVFIPRAGEAGKGWYLEGEKSGKVRVFMRLDTAVRVVKTLPIISGVWVSWHRRAADQKKVVSMQAFR